MLIDDDTRVSGGLWHQQRSGGTIWDLWELSSAAIKPRSLSFTHRCFISLKCGPSIPARQWLVLLTRVSTEHRRSIDLHQFSAFHVFIRSSRKIMHIIDAYYLREASKKKLWNRRESPWPLRDEDEVLLKYYWSITEGFFQPISASQKTFNHLNRILQQETKPVF